MQSQAISGGVRAIIIVIVSFPPPQVNFRALVLSYLLLNHWAQEVCTQAMFLNYEPELEPRSLTPGCGLPPLSASSWSYSVGPHSHTLRGLHAASQETGPERANPLNKGTQLWVVPRSCWVGWTGKLRLGAGGGVRKAELVGGGLGPLQVGSWACSPQASLFRLA